MYKLTFILFTFTIGLLGGSCASRPQVDERTFYVSIQPLRELIRGIVGDDFAVEVLVPPGASPETFEPTARQMIELNGARLIFNVGLIDFETALLPRIEASDRIVALSEGIEPIAGSCSHAHAGEREHAHAGEQERAHGVDPHIWTSPKALQRMAANAFEAIRRICPDSAKYAVNYGRLQRELADLDRRTAAKIAAAGKSYFIIYHPAYTYYARDYGLRQEAIETDGKEPSARHLAEIIDRARHDGVRRIFYQRQFPASTVEVVAHDIGAEAVPVDPLREDVVAGIDAFTDLIAEP